MPYAPEILPGSNDATVLNPEEHHYELAAATLVRLWHTLSLENET